MDGPANRANQGVTCIALLVPVFVSDIIMEASDKEKHLLQKGGKRNQVASERPSVYTSPRVQRLQIRQKAYEAAASRVSHAMRQAYDDAIFLSKWLAEAPQGVVTSATPRPAADSGGRPSTSHTSGTLPITRIRKSVQGGDKKVVVMGFLKPTSWKELALFQTWALFSTPGPSPAHLQEDQLASEVGTTREGDEASFGASSPLRYASILLLSLQKICLSWTQVPSTSSMFLRDLQDLLLPHQHLLLDLSWCVDAPYLYLPYPNGKPELTRQEEVRKKKERKGLQKGGEGNGMSAAALIFQSFLMVLRSRLEFHSKTHHREVGGRVGLFVAYGSLMHRIHACSGGAADGNHRNGKDRAARDAMSMTTWEEEEEQEEPLHQGVEEILLCVQRQWGQIVTALYGRRGNGDGEGETQGGYGMAANDSLPWIFSYGGPLSSLLAKDTGTGLPMHPPSNAPTHFPCCAPFPMGAGVKEVHALGGLLLGPCSHHGLGSWEEAVRFCRRLRQRGERHGMRWNTPRMKVVGQEELMETLLAPERSSPSCTTTPLALQEEAVEPTTGPHDGLQREKVEDEKTNQDGRVFAWSPPVCSSSSWGAVSSRYSKKGGTARKGMDYLSSHGAMTFLRLPPHSVPTPLLLDEKRKNCCGSSSSSSRGETKLGVNTEQDHTKSKELFVTHERHEKSISYSKEASLLIPAVTREAKQAVYRRKRRRSPTEEEENAKTAIAGEGRGIPQSSEEESEEVMWATDLSPLHCTVSCRPSP